MRLTKHVVVFRCMVFKYEKIKKTVILNENKTIWQINTCTYRKMSSSFICFQERNIMDNEDKISEICRVSPAYNAENATLSQDVQPVW